jgi:hypothetical protein
MRTVFTASSRQSHTARPMTSSRLRPLVTRAVRRMAGREPCLGSLGSAGAIPLLEPDRLTCLLVLPWFGGHRRSDGKCGRGGPCPSESGRLWTNSRRGRCGSAGRRHGNRSGCWPGELGPDRECGARLAAPAAAPRGGSWLCLQLLGRPESGSGRLRHRNRGPRTGRPPPEAFVLYAPEPTDDLLPGFYRRTASNGLQPGSRSMAPTPRFFCAAL